MQFLILVFKFLFSFTPLLLSLFSYLLRFSPIFGRFLVLRLAINDTGPSPFFIVPDINLIIPFVVIFGLFCFTTFCLPMAHPLPLHPQIPLHCHCSHSVEMHLHFSVFCLTPSIILPACRNCPKGECWHPNKQLCHPLVQFSLPVPSCRGYLWNNRRRAHHPSTALVPQIQISILPLSLTWELQCCLHLSNSISLRQFGHAPCPLFRVLLTKQQ